MKLVNRSGGITPSSIIISCMVVVLILVGMFTVASSSVEHYNLTIDESFSDSMDKSGDLVEQVDSMNEKLDDSSGVQDPGTGSLIFDGLNTIVLGIKATRAIVHDFVQNIGLAFGIAPIIVQLIGGILLVTIVAAIISTLWSRDV